MTILNVLAPVFLVIALGAILLRTGFVSSAFLREANRVTYWLGLPALLFSSLATSLHEAGGARPMLFAMLAATFLVVVSAYLLAWLLRSPVASIGTFVQGAFRGNLAYIGLPIVYTLPDVPGATGFSVRASAVVAVAPMIVLYNVLGVAVLLASQHPPNFRMVIPLARQLATTPPLIATLAGIAFALSGLTLPPSVGLAFEWLGQMALPLALLGIGGALVQAYGNVLQSWRLPAGAALIKTFLAPVLGYLVGRQFGLRGIELGIVAVFLATPTAAISFTMAAELKGDESLASGAILFSTFLSLISLSVIVGLL